MVCPNLSGSRGVFCLLLGLCRGLLDVLLPELGHFLQLGLGHRLVQLTRLGGVRLGLGVLTKKCTKSINLMLNSRVKKRFGRF